jgi:hypothetical protein
VKTSSEIARRTGLLLGLAAGCLSALATVGLVFLPNTAAVILLLMPGLCLNLGTWGFPHFPFWVCPIGNLVFYFLLFWLLGLLAGKIIDHRTPSEIL